MIEKDKVFFYISFLNEKNKSSKIILTTFYLCQTKNISNCFSEIIASRWILIVLRIKDGIKQNYIVNNWLSIFYHLYLND